MVKLKTIDWLFIISAFLLAFGCGMLTEKEEENYYVRDVMTSKCFKITEFTYKETCQEIPCAKIPQDAVIEDEQWEDEKECR